MGKFSCVWVCVWAFCNIGGAGASLRGLSLDRALAVPLHQQDVQFWNATSCAASYKVFIFDPPPSCEIYTARPEEQIFMSFHHTLNHFLKSHPCRTQSESEAVAGWIAWDFDSMDRELARSDGVGRMHKCVVDMESMISRSSIVQKYGPQQVYFAHGDPQFCCHGLVDMWRGVSGISRMVSMLTIEPATNQDFFWATPPLFTVVPQCWIPTPKKQDSFFGIPYVDLDTVLEMYGTTSSMQKTLLMTGYLGEHGSGAAVRQALIHYCKQLPASDCKLAHREGHKLVGLKEYYSAAKYVLNPAGDTPSRHAVWTAFHHSAVPVLFTSCLSNFYSLAYPWFLPPHRLHSQVEDEFGAGRWAVLLNSTSAILNSTYVRDELRAIDDETYNRMRAEIRKIISLQTYARETHPRRGPFATDLVLYRISSQELALSPFDATEKFVQHWHEHA